MAHEGAHGHRHEARDLDGMPATGLLLLDIGNSHMGLATWSEGRCQAAHHVPHEPFASLTTRLEALWDELPATSGRAVAVGSVCPSLLARVEEFCAKKEIAPFLVVGRDLDLPIAADVNEPRKVGTDRLCVAAAAFARLKCACVVADFGTALTIDLVADNNVFLGGTILPGMALCAKALHEHTAQLPLVEVGRPTEILGKDTESAIRNGVYAMMIGALREVVERYATDIGKWPLLVVTGGNARDIAAGCNFIDHVMPDLCFEGLAIAFQNSVIRHRGRE